MSQTLLVSSSAGPASHDLAFEERMLDKAADGRISLSVSSWPGPVVVLGYAQSPDDVDLEWCRRRDIPVLRRLSGGTGVIHRADLSVSLSLPTEHPWSSSIVGLYGRFLDAVQPALAAVGSRVRRVEEPAHATRVRSPVCFFDQLADTLTVDGKKAVGCSQTRRKGGVLIHAAVLFGLDATLYERVFGVAAEEVEANMAPALEGVSWRTAAESLGEHLGRALGAEPRWTDRPSPSSDALARYRQPRWAPVPDGGIG